MTVSDVDPEALRARYRAERDKRLRADGNDQYVEAAGAFARFVDDPYVQPTVREPLLADVEVAVVGGGFGGLLAAARLRQAGVVDVRLIEWPVREQVAHDPTDEVQPVPGRGKALGQRPRLLEDGPQPLLDHQERG